jgi:hypothetical protein
MEDLTFPQASGRVQRFGCRRDGNATGMTVTDPDVPDPRGDPRTLQADPGALGQGEDLASGEDDPVATGEDELASSERETDEAGGGDVTDGAFGGTVGEAPTADQT